MKCVQCKHDNRDIAKFCRMCGFAISQPSTQIPVKPISTDGYSFDDLVGLDDIKSKLSKLKDILEGRSKLPSSTRYPYNTIIIGGSGTAKTLISNLIASIFQKYGMTSKDKPSTINVDSLDIMQEKDLNDLFSNAKDGILIIDDAHKLVNPDGNASRTFTKLITKMDDNKDNPIVFLAGLPRNGQNPGLNEFVKSSNEENIKIKGRFRELFFISDYNPEKLCEITVSKIKKQYNLTFSPQAHDRLMKRFSHLKKEQKKLYADKSGDNGYLAKKVIEQIMDAYVLRKTSDNTILPEDIEGDVDKDQTIDEVLNELDDMTGMTEVKKSVRSIANLISAQTKREETMRTEAQAKGEKWEPKTGQKQGNHIILTGNPGTGKTTIVNLLAKLFKAIGALPTDNLVEVNGNDLKGTYLGQSKDKVNDYYRQAIEGVLFIDEAYVLANDKGPIDSFAKEAAETLMTHLENSRDKFICIAAGYETNMGLFLDKLNPGMRSRFNHFINIADYSTDELIEIFEKGFVKRAGFTLTDNATVSAKKAIESMVRRKHHDFANAREIRRFFEEITRRQAERISIPSDKQSTSTFLYTIEAEDINESVTQISIDDVLADLDSMVGMKEVKDAVRSIANKIAHNKKIFEKTGKSPDSEGNNICITGNPGTGKTTIVRSLAKLFKAIGLLPDDKPLEIQGADLKGSYVGQSKDKVNEYCRQAMGRVLFIDEAYSLVNEYGPIDQFANEAITVLLAHLENARDKFVCIVAGYQNEMNIFIKKSNPGMERRFKHYIKLPDYSADELIEIFERFNVQKAGYSLTDSAKEKAHKAIYKMVANKGPTFGNAGAIRTFYENVTSNTANRVSKLSEDQQDAVLQIIEAEDIP